MAPRSQPYRVEGEWTPSQAENIDEMFQILFDELRNGSIIVTNAQFSGILGVTRGGTGISGYAVGDLIYASAAATLSRLNVGSVGKVIRSNGSLPVYSTFTIPDTFAAGDIIYGSAANVLTALAKDTNATRYVSNTGASNIPAWAQINLANGVTGTLPIANGGTNSTSFTNGRVPFFNGTSLVDDADLTFATDTLTVTKISTTRIVSVGSANNRATNNQILFGATTDAATAVELTTDGGAGSGATNRISVPANTAMSVVVNICVKQSASANSKQMLRQFLITNNSGTTTIEGAVTTLGTDVGSVGLATVTTTITANDTDDCIKVVVNGVAATNLRYTAYVVSTETLYV